MAIYNIYGTEYYDDEPQEAMHRIGGPAVGVDAEQWPRHHGQPMQHLFTVDLDGLEVDIPTAEGKRLMSVFIPNLEELSPGDGSLVQVRWVTQEQIDSVGESAPDDFVPEPLADYRATHLELEEIDWEPSASDSFLGGEPQFEDAPPDEFPGGAFILQVSYDMPISREMVVLYLFEEGALVRPIYADEELMPRWEDALAASKQLVVRDEAPPEDALQKFGGHARGVSAYDVPDGMTHLFTYEWTDHDDWVEDGVAIAVFTKLKKNTNWQGQLGFFETRIVERANLDDWDPSEIEGDPLPEKSLDLVPIDPATPLSELRMMSYVGPRPALRDPSADVSPGPWNQMQLTEELLPNAPGRGTLHFVDGGSYPWWIADESAPQATSEVYYPRGTLYADTTSTALIAGWKIGFEEWSVDPELLEKLDAAVTKLNEERGLDLVLYVPGDTTTDPDSHTSGDCVLGRAVVVTEAWDPAPTPFEPQRLADAVADLPELTDVDWANMGEHVSGFTGAKAGAGAFLTSWGPLCYGALHVGAAMSESDRDDAKYKYVANQDMEQMWGSEGVDGAHITSVEFTDIQQIDPGSLDGHTEKVGELDDPQFFLVCRYD